MRWIQPRIRKGEGVTDYFISPKQKIEELEHERTVLLARIGGLTTWQRKQDTRISKLEAEAEHYKDAFKVVEAEMLELKAQVLEKDNKIWHKGYPNHVYGSEWFIAETTYGGKVVLVELPAEHSYDYTTKDETYIKKENVKRWMQFPNSEFVPYCSTHENCPILNQTNKKGEVK
jgi:hypothetical protein